MIYINPKVKIFFGILAFIGTIFACFGTFDMLSWTGITANALKNLQDIFKVSSIILQATVGLRLMIIEVKNASIRKQNAMLIASHKRIFNKGINAVLKQNIEFNVRLFLPCKKKFKDFFDFDRKHCKEIIFSLANIEGFSPFIPGLEYVVSPNPQGLVGTCYNNRKFAVESDWQRNKENYNLTSRLRNLTMDSQYCMCCPIIGKGDVVLGVISLETDVKINSYTNAKERAIESLLCGFSLNIQEALPHIFKQSEVASNDDGEFNKSETNRKSSLSLS